MKRSLCLEVSARVACALLVVFAIVTLARSAFAEVKLEGAWPEAEKAVSIDGDHLPRAQAVKRLADAAGWSVVVATLPGDPIDIHVKNQPANKVLEIILSEGSYVAKREGSLVFVKPDTTPVPMTATPPGATTPAEASAPPVPPATAATVESPKSPEPPAPPPLPQPAPPTKPGEDRTVTGGSLEIKKGETVHDVNVFGGSLDVYGTVTGDLSVMGGSVEMHDGAHVMGSASAVGGSLTIEDGARVDGDVSVVGGSLERGEHAQVGGSVFETDKGRHEQGSHSGKQGKTPMNLASDIGGAVNHSALLFVFGAVVLALASQRVEKLRIEVAARPMRSFALGIVGSIAAIAAVVALCLTIVGIPVAVVGVLAFAVAAYAGVAAVLTTVGEALLRHRTKNPYVHLALGCGILLVIGAIPYIGTLAHGIVAFLGIGAVIATRAAGLVPRRHGPGEPPAVATA